MEIIINDHRKIFAVQKEFSEMFPFLKLEFYSKPIKQGGIASKKLMKHISKTIAECRTTHSSGTLTIQPEMTTGELEQNFREVYGLSAQVFRKVGSIWMDTNLEGGYTLEKLNADGQESPAEEVIF